MRRQWLVSCATAMVAVVSCSAPAHAAFLIAPVLTALGVGAGVASFVGSLIVAGVSIGLQLLFKPKREDVQQDAGVSIDIQIDGDVPETLIVGRAVTGGSRVYLEPYGDSNQNAIEDIAIADHPCHALYAVFVEAQAAVLTDTQTDRGFTVDDYDGNLALTFWDGTQVAADAFAVAALGAHPERPWTTNRIGIGRTHARIHYVYNRDKVSGPIAFKWVVDGIALYNPAKDSSVGGSGAHRFDDLATHEFTTNLAVIAYNILRGIRVKDVNGDLVHFYGLAGTPAENLPLDNWFAAIAEADTPVGKPGGGTEPQFHGGMEIPVNTEPLDSCREILKATGGQLVEVGGVYTLFLGAPGLPSFEFDDGSFPADEGSKSQPILPLEELVTFVSASYVSPADGWIVKPAPPRIDGAREIRVGQRVEADLSAVMVQSDGHIQRVQEQLLRRVDRTRRHTEVLPPELFGVTPGDVGAFTSAQRGYDAKLFSVEQAEIDAGLFTTVHLLEVDHDDYDPDIDYLPVPARSLVTARTPPKIIEEFGAQGVIHTADSGAQRAALKVFWVPPTDDDIIGVTIRVRRPSLPLEVATFSVDTPDDIAAGEAIILAAIAPATAYEVQGQFKSFLGRATSPSLWIPVTTPDTRISQRELDASIDAAIRQVLDQFPQDLLIARQMIDDLSASQVAQVTEIIQMIGRVAIGVGARYNQSKATADLALTTSADAKSAIAAIFADVVAATDAGTAESLLQLVASSSTDDGVLALIAFMVRAGRGGQLAEAALEMAAVFTDDLGLHSRVRIRADQLDLIVGGVTVPGALLVVQNEPEIVPIVGGNVQVDLRQRLSQFTTTLTEDVTLRFPLGGWVGRPWTHTFKQDAVGSHTIGVDPAVFFSGPPDILPNPSYLSTVQCRIESLNPPKATAVFETGGNTSLGSNTSLSLSVPYLGVTYWDVAVDGPLIIDGPYDGYITPLGASLDVTVTLWGGGSQGVSSTGDAHNGGWVRGTDTTFDTMIAGGGGSTGGVNTGSGYSPTSGGTASGGDVNINGNVGLSGNNTTHTGGNGAGAPDGGGDVLGNNTGSFSPPSNALPGSRPGGGGAGEGRSGQSPGGGGGSGAKTAKSYLGTLLVATRLVVGGSVNGGTAGVGAGAVNYFGGTGREGRAVISL